MHKLKKKYDKIFDDIFFSKDFKNYMIGKIGYCPNGLTIDTEVIDDKPEFTCMCKEYGYEYSGDPVIGDFRKLNTPNNIDILANLMMEYLHKNYLDLYNEIIQFDVYFI